MCDGRPPFAGTREEILAARRTGPPPSLERDDLPGALRELVLCLLASEREQRKAGKCCRSSRAPGRLFALPALILSGSSQSDETTTLEFKSSLRTPVGPPMPGDKRTPKELERVLSARSWRL